MMNTPETPRGTAEHDDQRESMRRLATWLASTMYTRASAMRAAKMRPRKAFFCSRSLAAQGGGKALGRWCVVNHALDRFAGRAQIRRGRDVGRDVYDALQILAVDHDRTAAAPRCAPKVYHRHNSAAGRAH